MKNSLRLKGYLIFIVVICFFIPCLADQKQRYLWLSVLYVFHEPEKIIDEKEVCEYTSSKNWDSGSSQKANKKQCTYTPERYIPPKSIQKILRVHVDCQDKTYDAKGDGKGWRKLELQENVLISSIGPCTRAGYDMDSLLKGFSANEKQEIYGSTIIQTNSYQTCLKDSLNYIELDKSQTLKDPKRIGLSSPSQVHSYYLRLRSSIPNTCRKIVNSYDKGLSKLEIELNIWDPLKLDSMEYVIKRIPNCL